MREVFWRPRASLDLDGILVYLAVEQGAPNAAQKTLDTIFGSIERVADFPYSGRSFVDESLKRPYRRVLSGSYWIYYTFDDSSITIWRVMHTSRDTGDYGFSSLS